MEVLPVLLEPPETDSLSDPPEGVKVKDEIVDACQRAGIHLLVVEEMS